MRDKKTKLLCVSALLAAVTYIFTAVIHIPSHTGYTHVGDAFLYLAASLLPMPYGALAGALGEMMADLLGGYAMWLPATGVIKVLTALCFTSKGEKLLCRRNVLALLPAFVLCVGGYYLYEALLTGNWIAPLGGVPGYCVQVAASAAVYLAVARILDRIGFKKKLFS